MSMIKKILDTKNVVINSLSIIAGMISIVYVLSQYLELNAKYMMIVTGILASILGGLISFLFSYLFKKRAKAKIFISYSSKDKEFANKLINDLNRRNIQSFSDENSIQIGDNIEESLTKKILQTNLVVIVLSDNYNKSDWAKKELEFAKKSGKIILPVLKEKTNLPEEIANIKYADFTDNYDDTLNQLVKIIELKYQH